MILVSNIDLIMVDMFEGLQNAGIYALACTWVQLLLFQEKA